MKIIKEALAGTFESSDLLVKVAPAQGQLTVVINSEVIKQFGDQITRVVNDTLSALGVESGTIVVDDKGGAGLRHPGPGAERRAACRRD
ncbi:hypothetical protein DaDZ19_50500 [Dickeya ananatis]